MTTRITKVIAAAALCGITLLASAIAGADPGCGHLGGSLGSDGICHLSVSGANYDINADFPTDYPDQNSLIDYVQRRRDEFIEWAAEAQGPIRTDLDIVSHQYRSSTETSGTRSVVLHIGEDTGVHPVTTFETFTFDLDHGVPVTIDTLFAPGTQPLSVLGPIVQQELAKRQSTYSATELTLDDYRDFALTDDGVTFYFDQDVLLPHEAGPMTVSIPRTKLATLLA